MKRFGYIKPDGEFLVEPQFSNAGKFTGDFARAELAGEQSEASGCSIDRQGTITKIANLCPRSNFSEGIARTRVDSGGQYGFVDANGKNIIANRFKSTNNFCQGKAIVATVREGTKGKMVWDFEMILIDDKGSEIKKIGITGTVIRDWCDGLALCRPEAKDDDRPCYVNNDGKIVFRVPDGTSSDFSENMAVLTRTIGGESLQGFIDMTGKTVIDPKYKTATAFSEGMSLVQDGDEWYYIDQTGSKVISLPSDCSKAGSFKEGLAAVALGGELRVPEFGRPEIVGAKWGYIDRTGEIVIAPQFEPPKDVQQYQFSKDGLAPAAVQCADGIRYGFINLDGKFAIEPRFIKTESFSCGYAVVQTDS